MGHVGLKTRSPSQILRILVVTLEGIDDPKFMKLYQNVDPYEIYSSFESWSCWVQKLGNWVTS